MKMSLFIMLFLSIFAAKEGLAEESLRFQSVTQISSGDSSALEVAESEGSGRAPSFAHLNELYWDLPKPEFEAVVGHWKLIMSRQSPGFPTPFHGPSLTNTENPIGLRNSDGSMERIELYVFESQFGDREPENQVSYHNLGHVLADQGPFEVTFDETSMNSYRYGYRYSRVIRDFRVHYFCRQFDSQTLLCRFSLRGHWRSDLRYWVGKTAAFAAYSIMTEEEVEAEEIREAEIERDSQNSEPDEKPDETVASE